MTTITITEFLANETAYKAIKELKLPEPLRRTAQSSS